MMTTSLISTMLVSQQSAEAQTTSQATGDFQNVSTFGTGLSGGPVIMDTTELAALEGSPASLANMELNVSRYFVPMAIDLVFLDIGWDNDANTSTTLVAGGYSQAVANWLEVGDLYKIKTIFFFKQFGYFFSSPSWDQDFLNAYPSATTDNAAGANLPLGDCGAGCLSESGWTIASPDVYLQLREDIDQLYKWYGNYSSWIGIGEGATGDRNYYAGNGETIKTERPWDNGTVYLFSQSMFFQRNIDSTGYYLGTNVLSKVWEMFDEYGQETSYTVGYGYISETDREIYSGSSWTEQFSVPAGTQYDGFQLKAWLGYTGTPSAVLTEALQVNYSGRFETIETKAVSSSSISSEDWVGVDFASTLIPASTYQVVFSSATGSAEYYTVGSDNYGSGSILWVQSLAGANVTMDPYIAINNANWHATPGNPISFEVPNQVTVNTVSFLQSDRGYDPNNITFSVVQDSAVLASGLISLQEWRGASDSLVPYQLNKVITLYPGTQYKITFSALPSSDAYDGSSGVGVSQDFVADNVNPRYDGMSEVPTFQLSLENTMISASSLSAGSTDLYGSPGYQGDTETAMRFVPSSSGTLEKFEVNVIQADDIAGAKLTVTLDKDNETCQTGSSGSCSHPSPASSGGVLATGSISFSSINASFTSCPTTTGRCTWANVTFTGSTSLTAGTDYWIVLNSATNFCGLLRLVNPYQYLVYDSNTAFARDWYPPPDGPTALSFQIVTNTQSITNTYIGDYEYEFGTGPIAQSFESSTSFQLISVTSIASCGSDFACTTSIETDSGSDSPSGHVLAYSDTQFGIGLDTPVNITADTKYWIVENATCILPCSYPAKAIIHILRSDDPINYGESALHYEIWSGSAWENQPFGEGDVSFLLEASNSTIHTYSTNTLYSEISAYDDQGGTASGWNAFLNYEETSLMYNLTQFLTGLSGRQMVWYTGLSITPGNMKLNFSNIITATSAAGGPIGCPPTEARCGGNRYFYDSELGDFINAIVNSGTPSNEYLWSSFGNTGDNQGDLTPSNSLNEYLTTLPPTARNVLMFNDWATDTSDHGIMNMTQQEYSRAFGQLLQRMEYTGGWFGTADDVLKVLWLGSPSNDGMFPSFLDSAVNLTHTTDTTLASVNLTNFNVVVYGYQDAEPTASALKAITTFVKEGRGLVEFTPGPANSQDNILGLKYTSTSSSGTSTLTIESTNPITRPYSTISYLPYWQSVQTTLLSNESATVLVKDSNGNPIITTNNYFSGRGVLIQEPDYSRLSYLSYGDSWVGLLINAILYAGGKGSMTPVMWNTSYSTPSPYTQLYYSIDGSPGQPVLLWLSSNDSVASSFQINLNATYYGITGSWVAIDMQSMSVVSSGSGSDMALSVTIPPYTWMPIYLISRPANLQPVYSTASITSSSVSSSGGQYATSGPHNASSWLILSMASPPLSVTSSKSGEPLPAFSTPSALNSSKIGEYCTSIASRGGCNLFTYLVQQGWYYDSSDSLLYIHFQQGSPVMLEVSLSQSNSTTSTETTSSSSSTTTSTTSSSPTSTTSSTATSITSSSYSTATSSITTSETTTATSSMVNQTTSTRPSGCEQTSSCGQSPSYSTITIQSNAVSPVSIYVDGVTYVTPTTFLWPTGSNHTLTLGQLSVNTQTAKSEFIGWSGGIYSGSASLTITVGGDMNLLASYRSQYLVNITFADAEGRSVSPQSVSILGPAGAFSLTGSDLWLYSGTYLVTQAEWVGTNVGSNQQVPVTFAVAGSGMIVVPLPIYDEVIHVTDIYGLPISGATVTMSVGNQIQEVLTDSTGLAVFRQVPLGYLNGTVRYLGFSGDLQISIPGGHTEYVVVTLSYPVLATIFSILVVGTLFAVRSVRRKSAHDSYSYLWDSRNPRSSDSTEELASVQRFVLFHNYELSDSVIRAIVV